MSYELSSKQSSVPETVLPNGIEIFCLQKDEVPILYEQIKEYFRNGIEFHEGDTVFDVGANIGLFTLQVYQLCNNNVRVYAFEPVPAIFEVLRRNAQRFDPEKLKVFPCGLSQDTKTMTFAYYPNATALSNAYPNDSRHLRDQIKGIILRNFKDAPPFLRWLRWLPMFLRSFILDQHLKKTFQVEQVSCQLKTVSEIIHEYDIQQIDILKIDVEKSELDVLLGVDEQDWSKIKQVLVEVHDLDNRVEKITDLLKTYGLQEIIVEQEPVFKETNIFNLYARRQ
jgi:FkbM family methyltransferase